jgi:hypothetical protein
MLHKDGYIDVCVKGIVNRIVNLGIIGLVLLRLLRLLRLLGLLIL